MSALTDELRGYGEWDWLRDVADRLDREDEERRRSLDLALHREEADSHLGQVPSWEELEAAALHSRKRGDSGDADLRARILAVVAKLEMVDNFDKYSVEDVFVETRADLLLALDPVR